MIEQGDLPISAQDHISGNDLHVGSAVFDMNSFSPDAQAVMHTAYPEVTPPPPSVESSDSLFQFDAAVPSPEPSSLFDVNEQPNKAVELSPGMLAESIIGPEQTAQIAAAAEKFSQTVSEAASDALPKIQELSEKSLSFMDKVAAFMMDPESGKQKKFLLQFGLDFVGIPTVLSAGDVMGVLRSYVTARNGEYVKAAAQFITAISPGIPTGLAHGGIELVDRVIKKHNQAHSVTAEPELINQPVVPTYG